MAGNLHGLPIQHPSNPTPLPKTGIVQNPQLPSPHASPSEHYKPPGDPREKNYSIVLRKIRAHIHIRGNDLADAAAKLAVTDFHTLSGDNTLRVDTGSIAPRPSFWIMYTASPATPPPTLATGPRQTTLRPPWWTIPEADRLQMHAFTSPSMQLHR